jgi:zinc transport system substrate-binding protein
VRDALSRLAPKRGDIFADNFLDLERDLLDLDTRLAAIVGRDPGRPLIASHPVYQYLVRRYSLNLESVMWEPDAIPPETEWRALTKLREGHPAGWMLWESEPTAGNRDRLQQLGVQSTVFDPCANRPKTGDFLSVMSKNVANLKPVFDR